MESLDSTFRYRAAYLPNHWVATKCQCHSPVCPYPFWRRARLPGLWGFRKLPQWSAHVAESPPRSYPSVSPGTLAGLLGDLGPCGKPVPAAGPAWGKARKVEARGPVISESSCGGRGVCGATSGPSPPPPPPSRAASGRALRGGGSRCEGCVRAARGPARSSRLAGACEPGFGLAVG